ncbi:MULTISPECIES: GNAT family N-acetyltransferase [unclassified Dysgonomonas]|uniref:GNAT family N-acetyltransferase n=1 Tax=unclassified Dysgonomonas TaxID=2630389 RepID=UPI00067FAF1F|nr:MULTISPECIES: GNAT family N-acetyltransferase [unclassified Dysgonomonas]MBD8347184.1 GNAT family N-acetyltransferase [Dysgonomonas sp. HGC4]MBF0574941.1 GNAT family N-acetyltransferase [Dysgonomonas sp. GY617]
MELIYQENCDNINWEEVPQLLEKVGMSFVDVERHRISFENSFAVVFVFDKKKMVGIGRSISDGVRQSALYDIAIDPTYQGCGIGRKVMDRLVNATPDCNFVLYASPGKEDFYRKLGFKKMKTGMMLFADPKRMEDGVFVDK